MHSDNAFVNLCDYWTDSLQRSVLFWDTMRRRGNNYMGHLLAGQPPVLTFDYEIIMDGRKFERPVNYALARIVRAGSVEAGKTEKKEMEGMVWRVPKRPIVIIDPRAGHGPGIGGSKNDSEIGIALKNGHPVYYIMFFTRPQPGQTLSDVEEAEIRFLEEVVRRHPDADRPALIGNCQGGWAASLLCADRPDLTGLLVLNGAPLSYWSGVEGVNPMRYLGGLCGGVWLNDMLSDLGNGRFDGANLVSNFENLNPANTLWSKQYNLYSEIDTERERYLEFEKWWGGFYLMTADEIHFIVENLFIGDKLEKGRLELASGRCVNLKNINHPIVVFASKGDNITPPQQALDWIPRVYSSEKEIRDLGHTIVYIIHEKIGHLGIFVAGSIAKKEHTEIIGNFDLIEYLSPGLWEMKINEEAGRPGETDFEPVFEKRTIAEMLAQVGGIEADCVGEECGEFRRASDVSVINSRLYQAFVQPWIKAFTSSHSADTMLLMHPLRVKRYFCSDLNPFFWPFGFAVPGLERMRTPAAGNNPYMKVERLMSGTIVDCLNRWRDVRDLLQEEMFKAVYNSEALMTLLPRPDDTTDGSQASGRTSDQSCPVTTSMITPDDYKKGGLADALARLVLIICGGNGAFDRKEFAAARRALVKFRNFQPPGRAEMKSIIRFQVRLVDEDPQAAILTLADLVPGEKERKELYRIGVKIAEASKGINEDEKAVLKELKQALAL
jgi:pimeloyl-ACP methyl ester carboxylesterase/tellurite resistance protein